MSFRIIKSTEQRASQSTNRPTMHGSKADWNLLRGLGAFTNWCAGKDNTVHVTGEGPGRNKPWWR